MTTPPPPQLTFLAGITVNVGAPVEIGHTQEGNRRIIPIFGSTVEGPELRGCHPRMQSTGERWSWLNSRILVGTGEREPDAVRLTLFVVE